MTSVPVRSGVSTIRGTIITIGRRPLLTIPIGRLTTSAIVLTITLVSISGDGTTRTASSDRYR